MLLTKNGRVHGVFDGGPGTDPQWRQWPLPEAPVAKGDPWPPCAAMDVIERANKTMAEAAARGQRMAPGWLAWLDDVRRIAAWSGGAVNALPEEPARDTVPLDGPDLRQVYARLDALEAAVAALSGRAGPAALIDTRRSDLANAVSAEEQSRRASVYGEWGGQAAAIARQSAIGNAEQMGLATQADRDEDARIRAAHARADAITAHAVELRRAAADASLAILASMEETYREGWP